MLNKRKYLFGTTILAGVVAMTAPAFAQTTPPSQDPDDQATEVEEVVVTGSRIRRDPTTSPTPLIQVQREQLLETGLATVVDYLATIPALSNSLVPSDTTGSNLNDGGLEFANLRSLGSGRTLTLVDGRRHVGSAAGNLAVDVSVIPRLLIENIEIITGGGSSVYGADAVSGVVNYVLRKDFEGLEIDGNYGQLVQGGAADTRRISALAGINLLDDRLNIYTHGEYERTEEVYAEHINWLRDGRIRLGIDADPTQNNLIDGPRTDGFFDTGQFYGARRLDRPAWGSTTLANMQQPSQLSDPDVPVAACRSFSTSTNCFNVDPARTYWYDGTTARLANFGQRIGVTGANRPWNIGGDGEPANLTSFDQRSRAPFQESKRFQAGLNFSVTDNVRLSLEGKYVTEDAFDVGQKSFWDIFIVNAGLANAAICEKDALGRPISATCATTNNGLRPGLISGTSTFTTRLDNAFLPANVATAIAANTFIPYGDPTTNAPGAPGAAVAAPIALHRGFGIDRNQTNNRELTRYVAALEGGWDRVGFIDNFNWDISYTYGEMNNINTEVGPDAIRFAHAMDSVVDTAGEVNGRPGEIVCRVRLLADRGIPILDQNPNIDRDGDGDRTDVEFYTDPATNPEIAGCVPLNVFGAGNQSPEALAYISTSINVLEKNEQEAAIASFGGELFDLWGAGPVGFAVGAEYRREFTEGVGRDRDTAGRVLQLNTGPDFLGVEYESEEVFAELAIPLIRDSWLGEYAELSGSYRSFDYSTVGTGDVYGVNLVYRPIQDITFKTSFNTSFRVPNLTENFRPFVQTFVNPPFADPCDTRQIANVADPAIRTNRIANCQRLLTQTNTRDGTALAYDFGATTPTTADDYRPTYNSGIASSLTGNANLRPEQSESFTFSTVFQPRFFPDLSIVLDYYEIEISDVIVTPGGQALAEACVNAPDLDPVACSLVRRNRPNNDTDVFNAFKIGAPVGDPIGGFILQSLNFAKLETRGLDFTINYRLDAEEAFGLDIGTFNWNLGGLWLIDQKNFTNIASPNFFTDSTSSVFFPRTEFVSRLTWSPTDRFSVTWTADWQASQDLRKLREQVGINELDVDTFDEWSTGNFVRNDFSIRYDLRDDVTLRAGVTNAFDAEPPPYLGFASSFDPYGRRFNVGFSYTPY